MYQTTTDANTGSVEFDDRGNSRWIPSVPVSSDESLIRFLDIGALTLMPDEKAEVHRDGFEEIFRAGC